MYRGFWEKGLRSAWVNKQGVTPDVVNGYRRPQLVRGWESGILEFLAARTRCKPLLLLRFIPFQIFLVTVSNAALVFYAYLEPGNALVTCTCSKLAEQNAH